MEKMIGLHLFFMFKNAKTIENINIFKKEFRSAHFSFGYFCNFQAVFWR